MSTRKFRGSLFCGLLCLVMFFWSSTAFADVVMPPRDDCPEGSVGRTSHSGPHCSAVECTDHSSCQDELKCEERNLCVGKRHYGGRAAFRYPNKTFDVIESACSPEGNCGQGACKALRVCVPLKTPPNFPPDQGTSQNPPSNQQTKSPQSSSKQPEKQPPAQSDSPPDQGDETEEDSSGCQIATGRNSTDVPVFLGFILFCMVLFRLRIKVKK